MFCEECGGKLNIKDKFCINCGKPLGIIEQKNNFFQYKFIAIITIVLILSYVFFTFIPGSNKNYENTRNSNDLLYELELSIEPVGYFSNPELFENDYLTDEEWLSYIKYTQPEYLDFTTYESFRFPDQFNTYGSVAKIVCADNDYYYYGSGTNFAENGFVLTNLHVIDGNKDLECMVGFPDPETGLIREAYWSTPIIDNENETGLDLALLSVDEPVFDDQYNIYGFYNKILEGRLPYYSETDICLNTIPKLGDQVFILGYPPLSGGALTITDGLVSSLYSSDGYIITSAKIGRGNSGGLAVDNNNCFVGVPTAVYQEEQNEDYGEIIDAQFVYEFFDAVYDDVEEYANLVGSSDNLISNTDGTNDSFLAPLIIPGALRSCASRDCKIIRYYAEGATVLINGADDTGSWYNVSAHDDEGNIISGYMHKTLFE